MLQEKQSRTSSTLRAEIDNAVEWLTEAALPLWSTAGYDQQSGGFFERLQLDGTACVDDNRRARVQPRQVYCLLARDGENSPSDQRNVAEAGFDWFEKTYRRTDGLFASLASPNGEVMDDSFDLYNQAFALFGFAQMATSFPHRHEEMEAKALELLGMLKNIYAHPSGGFEEDVPTKLPLCSNPHMHLLEASLIWQQTAKKPAQWRSLADEIANMALTRFIDAETGALREFFDHDWRPYPGDKGKIVEPGHQFEWAWLLLRWSLQNNHETARLAAKRLFEIGAVHGVCRSRHVAVMTLHDDFSVVDPIARLWPQTEWLKAAILLSSVSDGLEHAYYQDQSVRAFTALNKFFAGPTSGLWYDKMNADGTFVQEPSPASSFYHITCAILEAEAVLTRL
jgi:mannose-6-phosphate isomerase